MRKRGKKVDGQKKDSKRSNSLTLLSKREDSENREQWKMNNSNSLASEQGHKGQTITNEGSMQKATTREREMEESKETEKMEERQYWEGQEEGSKTRSEEVRSKKKLFRLKVQKQKCFLNLPQ